MRKFFLLVFVIFSHHALAAHPWQEFIGCYISLEHNGQSIDQPQGVFSTIEIGTISVFFDDKGNALQGMEFNLFQHYEPSDGTILFSFEMALEQKGKFTKDRKGLHYLLEDNLRYMGSSGPLVQVKASLDIKEISKSRIQVTGKRTISYDDKSLESDDIYVLEKALCPGFIF